MYIITGFLWLIGIPILVVAIVMMRITLDLVRVYPFTGLDHWTRLLDSPLTQKMAQMGAHFNSLIEPFHHSGPIQDILTVIVALLVLCSYASMVTIG